MSGPQESGEQGGQNQQQAHDERDSPAENAGVRNPIAEIYRAVQQRRRPEQKREPDKEWERKWRRREVYALWIAAAVGVAAIIISTRDSSNQRDATLQTMHEMQAEQRAWMKLESVITQPSPYPEAIIFRQEEGLYSVINMKKGGARDEVLPLRIVVKNVGRSPALNVRVGAWPVFGKADRHSAHLREYGRRMCATLASPYVPAIFPDEIRTYDAVEVNLPAEAIAKFSHYPAGDGMRKQRGFKLWFYGCIRYDLSGSNKPHQTGFSYEVIWVSDPATDPAFKGARTGDDVFIPFQNVAGKHLMFRPNVTNAGIAD